MVDYTPLLKILVILLLHITRVFTTEQFKEEEFKIPGEKVDMSCKTELIKKYQPGITARWFKDGYLVNETKRITHDKATNDLWLSDLQMPDHGLYVCQVAYQSSALVSNEVQLHMGLEHYAMGEGESWMSQPMQGMGIPNIWSLSILIGVGLGVVWVVVIIVLQLKWRKRKKTLKNEDDKQE